MSEDQFCEDCGVTLDLHDDGDDCHGAMTKAQMLEAFSRAMGGLR